MKCRDKSCSGQSDQSAADNHVLRNLANQRPPKSAPNHSIPYRVPTSL